MDREGAIGVDLKRWKEMCRGRKTVPSPGTSGGVRGGKTQNDLCQTRLERPQVQS